MKIDVPNDGSGALLRSSVSKEIQLYLLDYTDWLILQIKAILRFKSHSSQLVAIIKFSLITENCIEPWDHHSEYEFLLSKTSDV